jgi:hypothetical protein
MVEMNKQLAEINIEQFEIKDVKKLLNDFSKLKKLEKTDFFKLDNNDSELSDSEKKLFNLYKEL